MPRLGGCRDDQMGAAEIYILCFCAGRRALSKSHKGHSEPGKIDLKCLLRSLSINTGRTVYRTVSMFGLALNSTFTVCTIT